MRMKVKAKMNKCVYSTKAQNNPKLTSIINVYMYFLRAQNSILNSQYIYILKNVCVYFE